ncbi:hypothetical protein M8J75_010708 [Diaphorina citri]|nr:hypothetical protein M8J75_010708 [Diaphorina citri]
MCSISFVSFSLICLTFQGFVQSNTDGEDVRAVATNLLELPKGMDIPPLIADLLRSLPKDVRTILKDKPLYELSKEELATIPVPLLYLLPSTQLYNLSGYQHAMLIRPRSDILSLADLVVHSMEDPDVKLPFLKALQYARNLSGPVEDALGRTMARWKSTEIQFDQMYVTGDPLAVHLPLTFMINLGSKLKGEMMFYLRTWLWDDHPYRGFNVEKWHQHSWTIRRLFTQLSVEDNYPVPLPEWKYNHVEARLFTQLSVEDNYTVPLPEWKFNHVEAFSHLIPTMTLAEFTQISLKERYNYKKLLNAPLNPLQVRYLFDTMYPGEQLYFVEFQEFAHFISSLQPHQLNRFYVNATDLIHAKYNVFNTTYATAKQIAEIIKVQSLWTSETSDETQRVKTELSNLGPLMYTLPATELAKIDPAHVDMNLLKSLESSKLSFPQAYELGHIKANISLATPLYQTLLQAIPAQSLQDIEPKNLPYDDLLHLLRKYPGTQDAFSATLMDRLRSNLGKQHLEQILQNPHRNKLLKYLPIPEDPAKLYTMLSQLYADPTFRKPIDQVDTSLIRTIMPAQVSYQMYIKDRFLFKGITCAHINNINTYELVVFVQDYLDYIQSTSSTGVPTKQTLHCLYNRLNVYLKLKATLPLLNKMEAEGTNRINEATLPLLNKMDVDSTNRINGLSEHELRAFGNTVALFTTEEIVGSRYLEQIVEMLGRNPREQLDVLKPRADFEIILEKYFEKTLNSTSLIKIDHLLTLGNLTHYIPTKLISQIHPKAFRTLVEIKLVDTRDFLLVLSKDQLSEVPTKSWTGMADLIVTNYNDQTADSDGVVNSFYQLCMSRLNNEKESQEYLKALQDLVQFYLVKIQMLLNTVKSADEIKAQSPKIGMTYQVPKNFKPTTIDSDEMVLSILDPQVDSHEFDIDRTETTTTEPTTTVSNDDMDNIYKIVEGDVQTNESDFKFWDVYAKPKTTQETTTIGVTESITTTLGAKETSTAKATSRMDSDENSGENFKSVEDFKSDETFKSSEDENFDSSEEIREPDELIAKQENKGRELDTSKEIVPCDGGTCKAVYGPKNNSMFNITIEKTPPENSATTIQTETEIGEKKKLESDSNVDQVIDFTSNEYNYKGKEPTSATPNESSGTQYTTTEIYEEPSTFATNSEIQNNFETNTQDFNLQANELRPEQNKDVIVNDLNKWNENHEKRENEPRANHMETNTVQEKIKHKKENRLEGDYKSVDSTVATYITTAYTLRNEQNNTTEKTPYLDNDRINELISNLPTVPSEDPGHDDHSVDATVETIRTNDNQYDDMYITKPEDRDILERKIIQTEDLITETTESGTFSTLKGVTSGTSTTEYENESNRIPTEHGNTETTGTHKTETTIDNNVSNAQTETYREYTSTAANEEMTTEHYKSETTTKNNIEDKEVTNNNKYPQETTVKTIDAEEPNSLIHTTSIWPTQGRDPNQYKNKLTDELSAEEPNSKDINNDFDYGNGEKNFNENNGSRYEEEGENDPTDQVRHSKMNNALYGKYADQDAINHQEMITSTTMSNHYQTESFRYESGESNTHSNYVNTEDENNNGASTTSKPKTNEMESNERETIKTTESYTTTQRDTTVHSTSWSDDETNRIQTEQPETENNVFTSQEGTTTSKKETNTEGNGIFNHGGKELEIMNEEDSTQKETTSQPKTSNYEENHTDDVRIEEIVTEKSGRATENAPQETTTVRTTTSKIVESAENRENIKDIVTEAPERINQDVDSTEKEATTSHSTTSGNKESNYVENENIDGTTQSTTTSSNKKTGTERNDIFNDVVRDETEINEDLDSTRKETTTSQSTTSSKTETNTEESNRINEDEGTTQTTTSSNKETDTETNNKSNDLGKNESETINEDQQDSNSSQKETTTTSQSTTSSNEEPTTTNSENIDGIGTEESNKINENIDIIQQETTTSQSTTSDKETNSVDSERINGVESEKTEHYRNKLISEKNSENEPNTDEPKDISTEPSIFKDGTVREDTTLKEEITSTTQNKEYELESRSDKENALDGEFYPTSITETTHNRTEANMVETTTIIGSNDAIKTMAFSAPPALPKTTLGIKMDFVPQTLVLHDNYNAHLISKDNNEVKRAFRNNNRNDLEFVVYDIPDDVTPDMQLGDSQEASDQRSNRLEGESAERSGSSSSEDNQSGTSRRKTNTHPRNQYTGYNGAFQNSDKKLELVVFDTNDEMTTPNIQQTKRANRRRRFVLNGDLDSNMNITCEALNLLGTITDIIPIENILVNINKEDLLDCLDLINKMKVSRKVKESIINKYYKNINEVLPLLGNIIADLSLEELRSINMNIWSLELIEHMNTINDTKKAELVVEKYLKHKNSTVLNLNELVILNNMLCYIPENIFNKSLANLKPLQLVSILKHIDTCSPKCLNKFSSLAINKLGTPMNWKYEHVYNLGTIPSGLNDTMWSEFIQQKHLKFNMHENNYKCLNEKQASAIHNAILIEHKVDAKLNNYELEEYGASEKEQDTESASSRIGSGNVVFSIVISYIVTKFL